MQYPRTTVKDQELVFIKVPDTVLNYLDGSEAAGTDLAFEVNMVLSNYALEATTAGAKVNNNVRDKATDRAFTALLIDLLNLRFEKSGYSP